MLSMVSLFAGSAVAAPTTSPEGIDWDQVENIKGAAQRIARVQRSKGADVAVRLIANCYKTHTLFEDYSRGFESCLVQDHLQTRILVEVYSRMQPDQLRRIGAPTTQGLVNSNIQRFATALNKYNVKPEYGLHLRKLVDQHGWPVFLKIVFPNMDGVPNATPNQKRQQKR